MRVVQFFSDEHLDRYRGVSPEAIARFLEDFRLVHGRRRGREPAPDFVAEARAEAEAG